MNSNVPYTVHLSGVGNTTEVGIVEVFELDNQDLPLLNISTRGPVLPDPTLELYSGATVIESNDNWVSSPNAAAIAAAGNAPTNSLESAILRTLAPGAYTAVVRGAGGSQGIGIVEIFKK